MPGFLKTTQEKTAPAKATEGAAPGVNIRRKPGRPKTKPEPATPTEAGCREGETRFTTILEKDLVDKVKRLAYWDRRTVKAVFTLALEDYVKIYEKKHGKLQAIPER